MTADQMRESQVAAAAAALKLLGYKVEIKYTGVRVIGVQETAPAAAVLKPGDMISDRETSAIEGSKRPRTSSPMRILGRRETVVSMSLPLTGCALTPWIAMRWVTSTAGPGVRAK